MTTWAYRDRVLAADSMISDRGCYCGDVDKIAVAPDGTMGAYSGDFVNLVGFLDWVRAGAAGDVYQFQYEDGEGIVIRPDGKVFWVGSQGRMFEMRAEFYAGGTGFKIALGAMAAGASAEAAVEICCKLDDSTQGPVMVAKL